MRVEDELFEANTQTYGGDSGAAPDILMRKAAEMVVSGLAGIVAGPERSVDSIMKDLAHPSVRWRVYWSKDGHQLRGFAAWYIDNSFGAQHVPVVFLQELHVVRVDRRKGISRLLLNAVERAGRQHGAAAMVAKVDKANTPALTVYKTFGMGDVWEDHSMSKHDQVRIKLLDASDRSRLRMLPRTETRFSRSVEPWPAEDDGYGLFMVDSGKPGQIVKSYDEGIPMTMRFTSDPGGRRHMVQVGATRYLDGNYETCDAGKANSGGGRSSKANNAKLVIDTHTESGTAYLELTRHVAAGEQIRYDYGGHYRGMAVPSSPLETLVLPRAVCAAVATLVHEIRERGRDRKCLNDMALMVCEALPELMRERIEAHKREEAHELEEAERKAVAKRERATAAAESAALGLDGSDACSGSEPLAKQQRMTQSKPTYSSKPNPKRSKPRVLRPAAPAAPAPPTIFLDRGNDAKDQITPTLIKLAHGVVPEGVVCMRTALTRGWAIARCTQSCAGGNSGQDFALLTVLATNTIIANGGPPECVVRYQRAHCARMLLSPLAAKAFALAMAIPPHTLAEIRKASIPDASKPPCERIDLLRKAGLHTSLDSGLALPDLSDPALGKAWWAMHLAGVASMNPSAESLSAFNMTVETFRAARKVAICSACARSEAVQTAVE
jgi:GNAT superfamily N-acetyltransferase